MKLVKFTAVLLGLAAPLALAKDKKKSNIPAAFNTAHYVYVQAEDGDIMNPGLFPEDRDAISNVQEGLREWKRYDVTINRKDADLIFIVRRGRLTAAQSRDNVGAGNAPVGGSFPNRNPAGPNNPNPGLGNDDSDRMGTAPGIGVRTELGPSDDLLRVFMRTPDGKLSGPVWAREMKDGLSAPSVTLLRVLRDAVDRAYPPQSPDQPATAKP